MTSPKSGAVQDARSRHRPERSSSSVGLPNQTQSTKGDCMPIDTQAAEQPPEPMQDRCSGVVELQIQPRIANHDHYQVIAINQEFPTRFVGFVDIKDDSKLCVQRCGRCHQENYVMAVSSGQCCWCGWDANDETQAKVVKDHR